MREQIFFRGESVGVKDSNQLAEADCEVVGSPTGHCFMVISECRTFRYLEQERKRPVSLREIRKLDLIDGGVHLGFEVIYPELVEVAQNSISRTARNQLCPIVKCLPVVAAEILASLLHFYQHDRFPHQIGERGSAGILLFLAHFKNGTSFPNSLVPEGLKQPVEKELRLPFFVPGNVLPGPLDEARKRRFSVVIPSLPSK